MPRAHICVSSSAGRRGDRNRPAHICVSPSAGAPAERDCGARTSAFPFAGVRALRTPRADLRLHFSRGVRGSKSARAHICASCSASTLLPRELRVPPPSSVGNTLPSRGVNPTGCAGPRATAASSGPRMADASFMLPWYHSPLTLSARKPMGGRLCLNAGARSRPAAVSRAENPRAAPRRGCKPALRIEGSVQAPPLLFSLEPFPLPLPLPRPFTLHGRNPIEGVRHRGPASARIAR